MSAKTQRYGTVNGLLRLSYRRPLSLCLAGRPSFEAARSAFEAAWGVFLANRTEEDFQECRRDRAHDAWKRAMWDAGLKLPTQVADGRAICFYGAAIGLADGERHIYAAHMETA